MNDSRREQHPLLYEDLSEEEHLTTNLKQKFQPMVFRGRARNKARGAAAIIRLWPEHWSSTVTCWWFGLGMIGIITFVIYNSIAVLAIAPSGTFKSSRTRFFNNVKDLQSDDSVAWKNVYMHLFVGLNGELDLDSYLPYIDIMTARYPDFNYNLIIVADVPNLERTTVNAEDNNELALSLLWDKNYLNQNNKVKITRVALSKYMENSPIRKYWRSIPKPLIQFLTRAVSIWDKGGIAFDPTILTPRSPHSSYMEKLKNVFENHRNMSKEGLNLNESKTGEILHRDSKKKLNNIRDIIDALEQNDLEFPEKSQQNLMEIDSKNYVHTTNKLKITKERSNEVEPNYNSTLSVRSDGINKIQNSTILMDDKKKSNVNNTFPIAVFPNLIDLLAQKPSSSLENNVSKEKSMTVTRNRKHVLPVNREMKNQASIHKFTKDINENLQPAIIAANILQNDSNLGEDFTNFENRKSKSKFTIDLKGNIIASVIPCHAFLGTIFNHALHLDQESVKDFIISEISIFCKGILSSCNSIDVILL